MMAMLLVLTSFTTYVQADEGTEDVPEPVTYKVELVNDEVSTLKFLDKEESSASFEAGSEVSFSVSLKEGYSLEKVEAKTGETEIEVVASENSYSFKMPEGAVEFRREDDICVCLKSFLETKLFLRRAWL